MKKLFFIIAILLVVSNFSANAQSKLFKHIVTVTFTENAPQNEIDEVDKSFKSLAKLKCFS